MHTLIFFIFVIIGPNRSYTLFINELVNFNPFLIGHKNSMKKAPLLNMDITQGYNNGVQI